MKKTNKRIKIEELERIVLELKKEIYFVKALVTGGIRTDVVYSYSSSGHTCSKDNGYCQSGHKSPGTGGQGV